MEVRREEEGARTLQFGLRWQQLTPVCTPRVRHLAYALRP
jgi:hypothetical protein